MEYDPTRMCELLVGLGDVEVLGIDDKSTLRRVPEHNSASDCSAMCLALRVVRHYSTGSVNFRKVRSHAQLLMAMFSVGGCGSDLLRGLR